MKAQDVERMADLGRRNIRAFMPQQHIDFYCNQQVLLSCVNDGAGRPVATALVGPLGFISCPSPSLLRVSPSNSLDPGMASDTLQACMHLLPGFHIKMMRSTLFRLPCHAASEGPVPCFVWGIAGTPCTSSCSRQTLWE